MRHGIQAAGAVGACPNSSPLSALALARAVGAVAGAAFASSRACAGVSSPGSSA
ncbi:hypothetical protein WJ968_08815 [Achromobacter xylosoxidans]